jgi:hypothetical protein
LGVSVVEHIGYGRIGYGTYWSYDVSVQSLAAMAGRQKMLMESAGNSWRAEGANFTLRSPYLGVLCA